MGCGGSRKDVKNINLPPDRISHEKYSENKEKFIESHQTFNLILKSNQDIYNAVEALKQSDKKEKFREEFDQFWDNFSSKFNNINKGDANNRILESIADSYVNKNFFPVKHNLSTIVSIYILQKMELIPEDLAALNFLLETTELSLLDKLCLAYFYSIEISNKELFSFSHINSCLNYNANYFGLSIVHISLDLTFPIDPATINGIGEMIENKNLLVLSINFTVNKEEFDKKKTTIEYNINQYSLVLLRAVKNSRTLKHFTFGFNFKAELIKHQIELPSIFFFSLIEVLKNDRLTSLCLIQFPLINVEILKCFYIVFKNLKNLKCLYFDIDIDKASDLYPLCKEVSIISGLMIFIYCSNTITNEKTKELLGIFAQHPSLKFVKLMKETIFSN
jgi:hypothetical protein